MERVSRSVLNVVLLSLLLVGIVNASCHMERVTGLNPYGDNFLAVRSGPGSRYAMINTLHTGDRVLVCGYAGSRWKNIYYGPDCYLSAGEPSGYCNSGWAAGRYLVPVYASMPVRPNCRRSRGGGIREVYYARLGYQDHYNSHGVRLHSVAAILRQDRANYHKFYWRDPDDTGDTFFRSKYNRSIFERIIANSYIPPNIRNAILYGEPYIRVTIYNDNRIRIDLL